MITDPNFFKNLAHNKAFHNNSSNDYIELSNKLNLRLQNIFQNNNKFYDLEFGEFGLINFPFFSMGNVTSINLFNLDELINFSYYLSSTNKYKSVADFGANIGLHSLILSKCFKTVDAYEPLLTHTNVLEKVIANNNIKNVNLYKQAVITDDTNYVDFVFVKQNSTGSHIADYKDSYGEREFVRVDAVNVNKIIDKYDFVKIDVEGFEAELLSKLDAQVFEKTDFLLEIGNAVNANKIFQISKVKKFKMYSQKNNWKIVKSLEQLPYSCREGNIIISSSFSY